MNPQRLAECLDILGWSNRHLGVMTGLTHKHVRRWLEGAPIPPDVAKWLEARARHAERTPPPERKAA